MLIYGCQPFLIFWDVKSELEKINMLLAIFFLLFLFEFLNFLYFFVKFCFLSEISCFGMLSNGMGFSSNVGRYEYMTVALTLTLMLTLALNILHCFTCNISTINIIILVLSPFRIYHSISILNQINKHY